MVFVLDRKKRPLMPCTEKRARKLLAEGRAVVHRLVPFVIRLKDRAAEQAVLQPLRLKIDPGYEVTGVAVVRVEEGTEVVIFFTEIHHRTDLSEKLLSRRAYRRSRRSRKTRYRAPRFDNRRRPEGWLSPGAEARVDQILSVVRKLCRWLPITEIAVESAKFDTQRLQNPEISGVEYQRGELFGYEVREYLLEKFGRKCAYCGREGVPLEVDHVVPKSRGGTDRVSNLTVACRECNQAKGNKLLRDKVTLNVSGFLLGCGIGYLLDKKVSLPQRAIPLVGGKGEGRNGGAQGTAGGDNQHRGRHCGCGCGAHMGFRGARRHLQSARLADQLDGKLAMV